jgi:Ohr subfamily peroxiredoxin
MCFPENPHVVLSFACSFVPSARYSAESQGRRSILPLFGRFRVAVQVMTGFLTISSTSRLQLAARFAAKCLPCKLIAPKLMLATRLHFRYTSETSNQITEREIEMTKLEKVLYTARVHTTGGRDGGASRTDDGRLQVALSMPGASATGTNPEQLFAAGWSACFLSAVKIVAGKRKIALPNDLSINAEVDLGLAQGTHHLAARLYVSLPGMDDETARWLVEAASHTCPYSLATSGNIEVHYNAITSVPAEALHA